MTDSAPSHLAALKSILPIALAIKLAVLFGFGLHRGMWRYTDLRDSWRLFQASIVSSLILVAYVSFIHSFQGFPRSIFIIDCIFTFFLTGGYRISIRTFFRYMENYRVGNILPLKVYARRRSNLTNVLIIGAGDAGEKLLREIIENPVLAYNVVGFADDDPGKKNRALHGVPVLGPVNDMPGIVSRYAVQEIFIALPSATGRQMRRIVEQCKETGLTFKTLPGLGEIVEDKVSVRDLREVNYQDLLGREQVNLDKAGIEHYLRGKTILVSGAGGSIGSELCRQIARFDPGKLVLVDSCEANMYGLQMELLQEMGIQNFVSVLGQIQDKDLMERIFKAHAPDVVFHAAAYKHVPLLEENPWQAVTNNIIGSRVLMETAARHNVHKFVVVSTDKAVRPTNVMGASKRMTEIIMHYMNGNQGRTAFMAVRFGNVVGSSGSVIPLFERQIKRGGPLTVTHEEVTRFFMTIEEASQLILQAGALGEGGEIFILDMGTPVKIMDMARDLIRLMGKVPDEDIAIKVVGLRPGEKLYEELITRGEGIVQAGHEKIMVLKPENQSTIWNGDFSHKMTEALQELEKSAAEKDGEQIRRILKSIINEYSPASSRTTLCS